MIVNIKKAILHILDGNSGLTVYSAKELDLTDVLVNTYLTTHIEKTFDDPALRKAEFNSNSGFMYYINEYNTEDDIVKVSKAAAERLYENISHSENITSADIVVCDCIISEERYLAILKFDNKLGYVHRVTNTDEGSHNEIINHYAILPSVTNKIAECAYIKLSDLQIKYKGKKLVVEGERIDLIADGLLECTYDFSTKESFNTVEKIAKTISGEYGGDEIKTNVKVKQYVKDTAIEKENIDVNEMAEAVFSESVSAKSDFLDRVRDKNIPETFEMNNYITKRVNKNVKIITDTGIEISFPAEYYMDDENICIVNNEDGTLSIQINNIGEISNK